VGSKLGNALFGIEALDQHELIRRHSPHILPLVLGIEFDIHRLAIVLWVFQGRRREVVLRVYGAVVTEREWPVVRGVLDWTPQVDDLEATLQKRRCIRRREMAMDSRNRRSLGLVNVDTRHGLPLVWGVLRLSWAATANGVVEKDDAACTSELLDELDTLWVVFVPDLLVAGKRLMLSWSLGELESRRVECILVLLPSDALYVNLVVDNIEVLARL